MMLIKDDSILLLRRAETGWADGMYTIPSGHIDEGERVISAGIRIVNTDNMLVRDYYGAKHKSGGLTYARVSNLSTDGVWASPKRLSDFT